MDSGTADLAREIVRDGYDRIEERYADWSRSVDDGLRLAWTSRFLDLLPEHDADVLELGIGSGVRSSQLLADRHRLTGVDISSAQLALARARLSRASLINADLADLRFDEASFDGVIALYTLVHLPRDAQPLILRRVARWLRPGGYFLGALAVGEVAGALAPWFGEMMFFACFPAEGYRRLLREVGFTLLGAEVVVQQTSMGRSEQLWVIGRREHEVNTA